jgi:dipeptidyl aminopeptidase/acylaminoacyl peptidase
VHRRWDGRHGHHGALTSALARFGKPVTLVKLQGDDHGLSKAPTRLEPLEAVGAFLHQYLN